jgi:hypothetical protein
VLCAGECEAKRKVFMETYGCQMNSSDSEIVMSIMQKAGYEETAALDDVRRSLFSFSICSLFSISGITLDVAVSCVSCVVRRVSCVSCRHGQADIIFVNTCAIRDNAERKVWDRLNHFKNMKRANKQVQRAHFICGLSLTLRDTHTPQSKRVVGVLGCMAERLKSRLLESDKLVDLVVGPDAYRSLPSLLTEVESGQTAMNVQLSMEETYADIRPVRTTSNNLSAYLYALDSRSGPKALGADTRTHTHHRTHTTAHARTRCAARGMHQVNYARVQQHVFVLYRAVHAGT